MAIPDPSINTQTQGGDSAFENIFVFGQLNYDFDRDNLKIRSIDVSSESSFTKDVTFSGNINVSGSGTFIGDLGVDELTARNANITGTLVSSRLVEIFMHLVDSGMKIQILVQQVKFLHLLAMVLIGLTQIPQV